MRILNQSLEMRLVNHSPRHHSSIRFPRPASAMAANPMTSRYLKMSKGTLYDFSGSFRRDRNYFDYNLLANSLLSTATPANPPWFRSRLHRTCSTPFAATLTRCSPFSRSRGSVSAPAITTTRTKARHYSTLHRRRRRSAPHSGSAMALDTYTGGVDFKLAKRTTLSYDQFLAFYRGDTSFQLAPTPFTLPMELRRRSV